MKRSIAGGDPCRFRAWRGTELVNSPITGLSPVFPEIAGYIKSLETERASKEQKMNIKSGVEERNRPTTASSEYFETVIIGGGQAGLLVATT